MRKGPAAIAPLKVPRIDSLLHRLQHARDDAGEPIPLLDELLLYLDDPPPGTADRWQEGAELCQGHGIKTSRMSVWRLYRAHILAWRREQNPSPPAPAPSLKETGRLHDQTHHLAAQRCLDLLNDPGLSPGNLIGLVQNDNHRRKIELARDQFNDRLALRRGLEQQQHFKRIEAKACGEQLFPAQMEYFRNFLTTLLAIPPDTTPSRNIPVPPPHP